MNDHYTTPQACVAAGVTYRQADYWARIGAVRPSIEARGCGSRRLYTTEEVADLYLLGRLRRLTIKPTPHIRETAEALFRSLLAWAPPPPGEQPPVLLSDDPRHGTYSAYCRNGCRCAACRRANADYRRAYRARLADKSVTP